VKPNTSGDTRTRISFAPGGRFTATGMPLRFLLTFIYDIQDFQLVGGPEWMASDRFDITATAGGDASAPVMKQMIRALLANRFGLVVREETREMPIYALVVARRDGRLGPKLVAAPIPCALRLAGRGAPPSATPASPQTECGIQFQRPAGRLTGGSVLLTQLASVLAPIVGRIVQDKSGLSGPFDFELTWTPETQARPNPAPTPTDSNAASIFTAIQEQLGLRLDPQRGPVSVLAIDRVNQPTPD